MNFVGLRHDVDGKVWTKNVPTGDVFRVDLATQKWERFQPLKQLSNGKRNTIYQLISDSQEQRLGGGVRERLSRQDRRQDHQGDLVSAADRRTRVRAACGSTIRTASG